MVSETEIEELQAQLDDLQDQIDLLSSKQREPSSEKEVIVRYADEHEAITSFTTNHYDDNPDYYFDVKLDDLPYGRSNIGSGRTDAADLIAKWGYEIDVQVLEYDQYDDTSRDLLVGVDLVETAGA